MSVLPQEEIRGCIKSFLSINNMTYQDLADKTGLSLQSINNYMSKTPLSEKTVRKFALALKYPEDLLLRGEKYYGQTAFEKMEERIRKLEIAVFGK